MTNPREIIDAKADDKGNISHVKLKGNQNFTALKKAIDMTKRGDIKNANVVNPVNAKKHLRTNPDDQKNNNLDDMAKKHE